MYFYTINMGSVGQRAAKLLAVKVGAIKINSATLAFTAQSVGLDSVRV